MLIVEDEILIAVNLDQILEEAGHTVVGVAPDMHAALAIAERESIDAALMDVDLARGTNGLETARIFREHYSLPSVFVTGRPTQEVRATAERWPPFVLIAKPYMPKDVLAALAKLVQ